MHMEEDKPTTFHEVCSEAQMKAVAAVVRGLLEIVLKDLTKGDHSRDVSTSQSSSSRGTSTQGECRTIGRTHGSQGGHYGVGSCMTVAAPEPKQERGNGWEITHNPRI